MKETKRRSDKCYGCSFCEYYCSLKECEFCASMLALSRRVDKNMGDIRTKGRTKTSSKHRHQFTCCDIDRLRKHGRESGEDEKVWLVAHGNVYEAHAFLRFHPAGREVMNEARRERQLEDFYMHSKRAHMGSVERVTGWRVSALSRERVWTVSIKTWVFGRAVYDYVVRSVGEFRF